MPVPVVAPSPALCLDHGLRARPSPPPLFHSCLCSLQPHPPQRRADPWHHSAPTRKLRAAWAQQGRPVSPSHPTLAWKTVTKHLLKEWMFF